MNTDIEELDRPTDPRGNGHAAAEPDTIPAPPFDDEMRDALLLQIAARVERLDIEAEASRDREQRIVLMVEQIHAEMFRSKKGTP